MPKDAFSPKTIRLFLAAPDGRLTKMVHILDSRNRFEMTRFPTLDAAMEKGKNDPGVVLILQSFYDDLAPRIESLTRFGTHFFSSRLFVYVPDLSVRTVAEDDLARSALLEIGVTAVFSQRRELAALLSTFERYAPRYPDPTVSQTQTVWDTLPWKQKPERSKSH